MSDIAIMDIDTQESVDLSEEDFDDIQSAIAFTIGKYPKKGATHFIKSLRKIDKKLWAFNKKVLKK